MERQHRRRPLGSIDGVRRRFVSPREPIGTPGSDDNFLGLGPLPPEQPKEKKVIAFEIKVPHINPPKLPYKKIGICLAATAFVCLLLGAGIKLSKTAGKKSADKGTTQIKPDFTPAVPVDKPDIAKVQGATSTYDPEKHVLTYTDTYLGENFTVSQQALTDDLKSNPSKIATIADSLGQKQLLDTQIGTVYLVTTPKTNEQTAVFGTHDLLIFIKAPHKVDESTWQPYINKLKFN